MTAVAIKEMKKEVKKYIDLADERMIRIIHAMLETDLEEEVSDKEISADWWDEMGDEEREAVETGIKQLKNGEGIPHEQVMQKHAKWLRK